MNVKAYKRILLITFLFLSPFILFCQTVDSTSFSLFSRLSFYTYERSGEFLIHIPPSLTRNNLSLTIKVGDETLDTWNGIPGRIILRLPFILNLVPSVYKIEATIKITSNKGSIYFARTNLIVLPYKSNEVKTDRFTGGLIVNRLPFFPFGFYCYSPVWPTLPEEEVVKGFNTMSPYQKILPETLNDRKAYMDRCAELGMKVHYNLLSVSGGGV